MREDFTRAEDLPAEWDDFAGNNFFLKRNFMSFMEKSNPCNERYYIFRDDENNMDSIISMFDYPFNLLGYTKIGEKIKINVMGKLIYVPLSVGDPGIILGEKTKQEVNDFLRSLSGFKLILNSPEHYELTDFIKGFTLPVCKLPIHWTSFNEYLNSMRSNYRYRFNKALKRGKCLEIVELRSNEEFDEEMYALYEQVYNHSVLRVEKLPIVFFKGNHFKIIKFMKHGKPLAFIQLVENNDELVWTFGGLSYQYNNDYDLYFNMILKVVEYGITHGFKIIDLGQTAEDPKLKLGSSFNPRYLMIHHSNKLVNWLIKKNVKALEYRTKDYHFKVFKD